MAFLDSYLELVELSEFVSVKDLTDSGIDFTKTDKDGWYPLQPVCEALKVEFVRDLIASGADVNSQDPGGITPLIAAIDYCHHNPKAAISIMEMLLDNGANIEGRGDWDKTPFLKACTRGEIEVINILISRGCNIHATANELGGPMGAIEFAELPSNSSEFKRYIGSLYSQEINTHENR